ncbi:MAG TPA: DUF2997 domain-containing protein, partial [Vicinamibacteria bacterium]|nr:DUF2997 domain-containing protein [Vicinamibacteria bacterium]
AWSRSGGGEAMAEKAELEISIGADGTVKVVTRGLRGEACLAETKSLEEALGLVKRREKTSEYYGQAAGTKAGVRNR